jgi:hypothetical protein
MSKQAIYPLPGETEQTNVRTNPTGKVHPSLTVTVKSGGKVSISTGRLDIKNGDKVIWLVDPLPSEYAGWEPVIQFSGNRFKDRFTPATPGSRRIEKDILGETGVHDDSEEPYDVILEKAGDSRSPIKLTYTTALRISAAEPCLVIDQIGDPPVEPNPEPPKDPRDHRWGHRRNRR